MADDASRDLAADAPPVLDEGEIHVWAVPLDPPAERVAALRRELAPDEAARADRFRFDRHRRRFQVARASLRRILGTYLRRPAASLDFVYGEKGKPSLAPGSGAGELDFNLSHSSELALLAVTRKGELGVDVERLRPMPDGEAIAERFFSRPEREVLRGVPAEQKDQAFFLCWTRKEAYVKATGDGLSMPLSRFEVSLEPGSEARMRSLDGDPAKGAAWSLRHLEPAPGYVGALAVEGPPPRVRLGDWPP